MGDVRITSGFGKETNARVGEQGRVWTHAMTHRESQVAGLLGLKYSTYTGPISLTSATAFAAYYMKNTGTNDLSIRVIVFDLGSNTGGSGDVVGEVIRNPRAGGIITSAVPVDIGPGISANQNYGSTNILRATVYKGAQSDGLFTDFDGAHTRTRVPIPFGQGRAELDDLVMPPNTSIGIHFYPATGTTAQTVEFGVTMFERNNQISGITKI